jgi:probable HAF family extracellular repeat protein
MVDLGALPSSHPSSNATAVNDNGQVVGSSSVGDDIYPSQPGSTTGSNAFSWTPAGGMVDVSPVSGEYGGAYAVNDKGQVVGTDWGNHNAFSSGFSWTATGGRIRLVPFSGGVSSGAVDINSAGQIAGSADADDGNPHAVIWSPADLATGGNDTLTGTSGPNLICGLGGDDTINGLRGNDTLYGDACGAKARALAAAAGRGGNDTLNGGKGNDKLYGADGNDTLNGRDGNDELYGGRGSDKLNGGPGVNSYSGGPGNDTINARNGKKETVDCGPGNKDVAVVDKQDKTKACEKVERVKK